MCGKVVEFVCGKVIGWVEFVCGEDGRVCQFVWGRCVNLWGEVAEFVWRRWSGVSIFCGGRCSNLCVRKVVRWVEFVCGEGGRVG